jgi:hypothetical protein
MTVFSIQAEPTGFSTPTALKIGSEKDSAYSTEKRARAVTAPETPALPAGRISFIVLTKGSWKPVWLRYARL